MTDTFRKAALTVADRAADAGDCRQLLDALGLLAEPGLLVAPGPTLPRAKVGRPPVNHGHGHHATYIKGCRCAKCRTANTAWCAEKRKLSAADPSRADRAGHGKTSTYKNHNCRCPLCTAANTADCTAYRARQRARKAVAETGGAR